jgi:hypothetical protein
MTVPVIDLGEVSVSPGDPEEFADGRRPFERIHMSRAAKLAVAVLAVLVLGGSGLPGPPVLREVWSAPLSEADSMVVDGDSLYVHRGSGDGGRSEMTAYELGTGAVRWTRRTSTASLWTGVEPRPGVLLLPGEDQVSEVTEDGATVTFSYGGTLTALDPATGEVLWKRPGMQYWEGRHDTMMMFERVRDGTISWLRLVRARDGSIVWERRAPAGTESMVVQFDDDVPTRVVTATSRGELMVLRHTDGAPIVSGTVPWTPTSYSTGAGSTLSAVSGRLVVTDTGLDVEADRGRVTVYRTDDLGKLWSRDTTGWPILQDCGPVVCVGAAEGTFEAVDPETGTKRWEMEGGQFMGAVPGTGRLLIAGADDKPKQTLVDAATGRAIGTGGSGGLLYRDLDEGTVTLLRDLSPTSSAVSRLDTATGQSRTLGVVTGGDQRYCVGEGRRIACSLGDRLVVTAVG